MSIHLAQGAAAKIIFTFAQEGAHRPFVVRRENVEDSTIVWVAQTFSRELARILTLTQKELIFTASPENFSHDKLTTLIRALKDLVQKKNQQTDVKKQLLESLQKDPNERAREHTEQKFKSSVEELAQSVAHAEEVLRAAKESTGIAFHSPG